MLSDKETNSPQVHTLHTVGLVKAYKGRTVVNDVSFELQSGQVVGLLGPNGAGKTTSFYMAVGLVKPDAGQVLLDGKDITSWPMHMRAKNGVAYLPQEASVFRKMTAEENILAVLETLPLTESERRDRLQRLLDDFSLNPIAQAKSLHFVRR